MERTLILLPDDDGVHGAATSAEWNEGSAAESAEESAGERRGAVSDGGEVSRIEVAENEGRKLALLFRRQQTSRARPEIGEQIDGRFSSLHVPLVHVVMTVSVGKRREILCDRRPDEVVLDRVLPVESGDAVRLRAVYNSGGIQNPLAAILRQWILDSAAVVNRAQKL